VVLKNCAPYWNKWGKQILMDYPEFEMEYVLKKPGFVLKLGFSYLF